MISNLEIEKIVAGVSNMSLKQMQTIEESVWILTRARRDEKIAAHPMGLSAMAQAMDGESLPKDNCFSVWAAAHAEEHDVREAVRRAFLPRREELSRAADAAFRAKNTI